MFEIIFNEGPVDVAQAMTRVPDSHHGAQSVFVGVVRNRNQGRDVVKLSYDLYEPLARKTLEGVCEEALEKWGRDLKIYVAHSWGELKVGEPSVVIAVSSPHRGEAFDSCRYVIEELKHRAPIWKKEFYVDGESEWVKGHALCGHHHQVQGDDSGRGPVSADGPGQALSEA